MNLHRDSSRLGAKLLMATLATAAPLTGHAGSLLQHIDALDTHGYIVTATLSIYDANHVLIDTQSARAESLFENPLNTGSSVLFNGSLTFAEPFPLVASGAAPLTLYGFEVNLATLDYNYDTVHVSIDWLPTPGSLTHDWFENVGDDFENGIAYYQHYENYFDQWPPVFGNPIYEGCPGCYGYNADLTLEFASGIPSVPVPGAVWLLGSGLIGLASVGRRRTRRI